MKAGLVFFTLLLFACASAKTYYVSSSPTSPYSCTQAQPCRVSDLPSSFTTSDSVIFMPGTGVYTFTKTLNNPAVTVQNGCVFSATTLTVRTSPSLTVTFATFRSSSSLNAATITSMTVSNCNFTNSQTAPLDIGTLSLTNTIFVGMSGTQRVQISATTGTVTNCTFTSCSTSVALFQLVSILSATSYTTSDVDFVQCTTTADSIFVVRATSGRAVTAGVTDTLFDGCTTNNAFLEINNKAASQTFTSELNTFDIRFWGGSTKEGLVKMKNEAAYSSMNAIGGQYNSQSTDFGSGPAFTQYTASGSVIGQFDGFTNNNICSPTNMAYFDSCTGVVANMLMLYSGNNQGTHTNNNCSVMDSSGTACTPGTTTTT